MRHSWQRWILQVCIKNPYSFENSDNRGMCLFNNEWNSIIVEEYYQNVVNSLKSYSQTCAEKVAIANKKLKQSIENVEFRRNIPKMFQ